MSTNYRIGVVYSSRSDQLRADLARIHGQLSAVDRQMGQASRTATSWGNTMKAVGTTIRYAFAGGIVYSVVSAINRLGEFSAKLGEINSLAGEVASDGTFRGIGTELDRLGDDALRMSDKYGLAVNDILLANQATYSSFNANGRAAREMRKDMMAVTDVMQQIQLISEQADPASMARAVTSLITSDSSYNGKNEAALAAKYRDIIGFLISESPTIRGEDIARDVGRLGAAGTAANMTREQAFAMYLMGSRAGGSVALLGRGLTQTLQTSLMRPQTPDQKRAFEAIVGTSDPSTLSKMSGMEILRRIQAAVAPSGVKVKNKGLLGDEEVDPGDLGRAVSGVNMTSLYSLFGRTETVRTLLQFFSQGGVPELEKTIKKVVQAEEAELGRRRAEIANNDRYMQQLQQSFANFNLQLIRGGEDVFRGMKWVASNLTGFAIDHPNVARGTVAGMVTAATAWKLIAGTEVGKKILERIPGFGKYATRASSFAQAGMIGSGLGAFGATGINGAGDRSNPFWVVIDPLSWFMPGAPSSNAPNNLPNTTPSTKKPPTGIPAYVKGAGLGMTAAATAEAYAILNTPSASGPRNLEEWAKFADKHAWARPLFRMRTQGMAGIPKGANQSTWLAAYQAFGVPGTKGFNPNAAHDILLKNQRLRERAQQMGPFQVEDGELTVTVKDTNGNKTEAKVPVRLWDSSGGKTPKHKGKAKTVRQGGK